MKTYVKNTLILSSCMVITKIVGAVYRILLSNILGTQGIGLYQLVFPVYSLFLVFVTGGMPTYIAQKVSVFRATNNLGGISKLIKNCTWLCFLLGLVFCVFLCAMSRQLSVWQGNQMAYLGYITVAVSIVFSFSSCVLKGYFMGYENMKYNAISGIIEQFCKLVFGLVLAYLLKNYGLNYAVCGAFGGVLFAEIISFFYILFVYSKNHKKVKTFFDYQECKNIFKGFLPITLASFILPLSSCVDSFLVVNLLTWVGIEKVSATSLFGIATGMVSPLVNFPVLLCGTISTALLPSLTFALSKKQDTNKTIEGTYFFVWIVSLPCAFGILATAPNIISICFPILESVYFDVAVYYLSVSAFNIIWLSCMQISSSILNSIGKFVLPLACYGIGFFVKIVLLILLTLFANINIMSLAFASVISNSLSCVLLLYFVKKNTMFCIKLGNLVVPLVSSIIMMSVVMWLNSYAYFGKLINFGILILVAVIVYFAICVCFRVVNTTDIKKLFKNNTKQI